MLGLTMLRTLESVMKKAYLPALAAMALSACSLLPSSGANDAVPPTDTPRVEAPAPLARGAAERQCLADLGRAGAQFDALPDRYTTGGCSTLNTVQMHALASDQGRLAVHNIGPVTCPVSAAFAAWARYGVDRAAQQVFGSRVDSIQTMGSFACRNVAGTGRLSAHASADAIDIGGFVLADGRRISVREGWHGTRQEREFLQLVHRSACRRFDTVLGPDYNAAHADHLHVEGVIDGNSYCR